MMDRIGRVHMTPGSVGHTAGPAACEHLCDAGLHRISASLFFANLASSDVEKSSITRLK